MNKRLVYGIASIILAAVIAFAGIPLLSNVTNGKTTVVKVSTAIPKGDVISENQVQLEEVGKYGLSQGAYTKLEDVVGKYAATDLVAGAGLLPGNVSNTPITSDVILSRMPAGKVAVSFSVKSLASGLSDKLQAGDIIRIYHYKDAAVAVPELQYVKVLAVTDSKGGDIDKSKPVTEDEEQQQSATVVVQASPVQAQLITELENSGSIHVALILRGDETLSQDLLKQQDELLTNIKE